MHGSFVEAVQKFNVSIEHALMAVTSNPAQILGINKGVIKQNADADLVLLNKTTLAPTECWSKGVHMVSKGKALVKGTFE